MTTDRKGSVLVSGGSNGPEKGVRNRKGMDGFQPYELSPVTIKTFIESGKALVMPKGLTA